LHERITICHCAANDSSMIAPDGKCQHSLFSSFL
jgi:hypothetical protein